MSGDPARPPRFAFSRRDPAAILDLAERRQRATGCLRVMALGGAQRDRVYFAQLLANTAGQAFAQLDLAVPGASPQAEKAVLEKVLGMARATPTTLLLEGVEGLLQQQDSKPARRAEVLGGYLKRALAGLPGTVVFGMPEQVEPDYARSPPLDMVVTFRAPSGGVLSGRPLLQPAVLVEHELLPAHNFQVEIDGQDIGLCGISAPQLVAGPYGGFDFNPPDGVQAFAAAPAEQRAAWPTITLRRGITRSKLLYAWKQAQYAGKPQVRDLVIRQLDWPGRHEVNTWIVRGCWAKRWTGPTFDALHGAVAIEELELYYAEIVWR